MNDRLRLRIADWPTIEQRIRRIPQYSDRGSVSISERTVSASELRPMCQVVRVARLKRVRKLAAAFQNQPTTLFAGVWIDEADGVRRLIPPPIVEDRGDARVIIDGLHRTYFCLQSGAPCTVAMVAGCLPPLPADVLAWSDVRLVDEPLSRQQKFRNLNETRFRPIRERIDEADRGGQ